MAKRDTQAEARLASLVTLVRASAPTDADVAAALDRAERPGDAALAEERLVAACLVAGAPAIPRTHLAAAVRTSLRRLEAAHPGKLVEVRVPPFAAVQIGVVGVASAHTRGTPPNVVETDAATWLALAHGVLTWVDAVAAHRVQASGVHADITDQLRSLSPS